MYNIINFYERTVALLASQFRGNGINGGRTNFQKMLASLVSECYDVNDVELELYGERWLATAVGVQLDGIGEILGLARVSGQSDSNYREALYFQVRINRSTGTPEELIQALAFLTQATYVQYLEPHPAFYQLYTNGLAENFSIPPGELVEAITAMGPAGVQYVPITASFGVPIVFTFASDPLVEDFYVAPDPDDLDFEDNFFADPDGFTPQQFLVNRGLVDQTGDGGGFAEDDYDVPGAGALAEVLVINGHLAPPL